MSSKFYDRVDGAVHIHAIYAILRALNLINRARLSKISQLQGSSIVELIEIVWRLLK